MDCTFREIEPVHFPTVTTFNRGSVMLASAKEGLYHPCLPTFRRMDMDTISQKLPYEHCRTTTKLTKDDFRNASVTLFRKSQPLPEKMDSVLAADDVENQRTETRGIHTTSGVIHPDSYMSKQRPLTFGYGEELRRQREKFAEVFPTFVREPRDFKPVSKSYQFQYIPPRVSREQTYKTHFVDWTGIRPIAANTYSRYRDAHPKYSENVSSRSWRP